MALCISFCFSFILFKRDAFKVLRNWLLTQLPRYNTGLCLQDDGLNLQIPQSKVITLIAIYYIWIFNRQLRTYIHNYQIKDSGGRRVKTYVIHKIKLTYFGSVVWNYSVFQFSILGFDRENILSFLSRPPQRWLRNLIMLTSQFVCGTRRKFDRRKSVHMLLLLNILWWQTKCQDWPEWIEVMPAKASVHEITRLASFLYPPVTLNQVHEINIQIMSNIAHARFSRWRNTLMKNTRCIWKIYFCLSLTQIGQMTMNDLPSLYFIYFVVFQNGNQSNTGVMPRNVNTM